MANEKGTTVTGKTTTEMFTFDCGSEVKEYQVMIHVNDKGLTFQEQLEAVLNTYDELRKNELKEAVAVFERFFISDAASQADLLNATIVETSDCAVSIIQQPPLNGTLIALWIYLQTGVKTNTPQDGLYEARHGNYRHLWCGSAYKEARNAEYQTRLLFNDYVMQLAKEGCRLADNCIRTWLYVDDIGKNYQGLVKARNEVLYTQNLSANTHFIASTGISGKQAIPHVAVQMDAYAVDGIKKEQVKFLSAPSNLVPTHDFGVSFERGTSVTYGDRRHVFISGTACIDNSGAVMHKGNISRQTERTLENIEALLNEAECSLADIAQLTVYLRNPADYDITKNILKEQLHDKPQIIVCAPCYNPERLIEMECIAMRKIETPQFAAF